MSKEITAPDVLALLLAAHTLREDGHRSLAKSVLAVVDKGIKALDEEDQILFDLYKTLSQELAGETHQQFRLQELIEGRKHLPTNVLFNGLRLKKWLLEAGMTQKDLAERLGVHETTLGGWVNGYARPSIPTLEDLSKVTERPVAYWVEIS